MKKLIALALAAIMPFSNPIVGGNDTLIREKIQSENYVAGVSGWSINRDGTAEFGNVITRGEFIAGDPNDEHIRIGGVDAPNGIAFYSGMAEETFPATSNPFNDGLTLAGMAMSSATLDGGGPGDGAASATVQVWRYDASLGGRAAAQITADDITLNAVPATGTISINKRLTYIGQAWTNITLQNSWVEDAASVTPQYMIDHIGMVHVRGAIKNGTTVVIGTLPAGFRPTGQPYYTPAQHAGTSTASSHIAIGTDGVMTITTNLASAQTRLRLGFSFPTFN